MEAYLELGHGLKVEFFHFLELLFQRIDSILTEREREGQIDRYRYHYSSSNQIARLPRDRGAGPR